MLDRDDFEDNKSIRRENINYKKQKSELKECFLFESSDKPKNKPNTSHKSEKTKNHKGS